VDAVSVKEGMVSKSWQRLLDVAVAHEPKNADLMIPHDSTERMKPSFDECKSLLIAHSHCIGGPLPRLGKSTREFVEGGDSPVLGIRRGKRTNTK
jgi:hypothetical protein